MSCDEPVDREVVIGGVSFHERRVNRKLVYRYPCVFDVKRHPQRELIQRLMAYPRKGK